MQQQSPENKDDNNNPMQSRSGKIVCRQTLSLPIKIEKLFPKYPFPEKKTIKSNILIPTSNL